MGKDKAIFSTLDECSTKQICVHDDRSIKVVRFGTIQINDGKFNYVIRVLRT